MNNQSNPKNIGATYRPALTFYHANPKGTGSALKLELLPASDAYDGCIMAKIANQNAIGNRQGPNPTYARFDWENAIVVKLDFNDLCKVLQVFRGECESIDDGKGLYHRSAKASTRICLKHLVDNLSGYSLEVYRTSLDGQQEQRAHFLLSLAESLGVCEAIAGSMSLVSFGIPMAVTRPRTETRAESGGRENDAA